MDVRKDKILFKLKKEDGTNFTLSELIFTLKTTEQALKAYYKEQGITNNSELENLSPEIVDVGNGCIEITAIITSVVSIVAADFIVAFLKKIKNKLKVKFANNKLEISKRTLKKRQKWTYSDDYKVSYAVVYEYCNKNKNTEILDLIKTLNLSKPYSIASLKIKVYNTKYLLEVNKIYNSLNCSMYTHYSKQHEEAFLKACKDLEVL